MGLFSKAKSKQEIKQEELPQDYWSYVKRQFKKNKRALFSFYFIAFLAVIALFADFLANEKPIIAKYKGSIYAPVLKDYAVSMGMSQWHPEFQNVEWKEVEFDWAIWPLVPYLPTNLDYNANFASPFGEQEVKSSKWRHWLGTDDLGRDVMSGMIHGTRIAFLVGIVSMSIAFVIGIFFGSLAGFFGDTELTMSRIRVVLNILALFFAFFYAFYTRSYVLGDTFSSSTMTFLGSFLWSCIIFLGVMALANIIVIPLKKIPFLGAQMNIPVDILLTRVIEVIVSVPPLILILAVAAIAKPSIFNVMAVIGLISWTGIARFIRAELLRVRKLEYIEASRALGFSRTRALLRHAIPNALSPVFIALAFGVAGAILIEAFLSFLGIGVPPETVTWGQMLSIARTAPTAWWMAIFPGFAIFLTVTLFNLLGEGLTDALDPRLKQ